MSEPWRRRLKELSSPPMLVALLALVVATGGTSYATVKITSKDIKDHTITVRDLSPKTVKKLRGQRGAQGVAGADGVDGRDATAAIPSGRTVTGTVFYRIYAGVAGDELYQSVALPARAPEPIESAGFAPDAVPATTGEVAGCAGTWAAPTAPAGTLCAYYKTGASNLSEAYVTTTTVGQDTGFVVALNPLAVGQVTISLSWAYTAP